MRDVVVRRDRGADGDAAVLGDFRRDVADAADVDVAVLLREAELAREVLAHQVAVEDRDRPAAELEQLREQHVGDRALAASRERPVKNTVKPCLPRAGWLRRSSFTTSGYENQLGISVPRARRSRSSVPLMSSVFLSLRHFVDGVVLVFVRHEDHLLEVDHLHAELFFVLLHELLSIVRAVERLAGVVLAGAGVVAADDEVRAAVVLADDRVPDRFARAAHPHRQRQQREVGRVLRVVGHERLVAANARVVVDVARLGHADDRMDEQVGFLFLRGAERELVVGAVHRVAGLEGDDLASSRAWRTLRGVGPACGGASW